jgi:hypothetical protein
MTALSRGSAMRATPTAPEAMSSIVPPPPMAPLLLEQVKAAEALIVECESRVGVLVLAEAQGTAGATEALAALESKIAAARAERARKDAAHKAAIVADRVAAEDFTARIRAMPAEKLIAGITKTKCPDLCHAGGCAIGCGIGICMHPRRSGIPPRHQSDMTIRTNHLAANNEILRQEKAQ